MVSCANKDLGDVIEVTSLDGTKTFISKRPDSVQEIAVDNLTPRMVTIVSFRDCRFIVRESKSEILKKISEYRTPPTIEMVQKLATQYGLILLEMTNWNAIVGFEKDGKFKHAVDFRTSDDMVDLLSKAHMELTIKYKESGIEIPRQRIIVNEPRTTQPNTHVRKSGCCGGQKQL